MRERPNTKLAKITPEAQHNIPMELQIKRIYAPNAPEDGLRILVDRLWPRGLAKADAQIDLWIKDLAPSTALRKWFGHTPEKWAAFQFKYIKELEEKKEEVQQLCAKIDKQKATLLYAAKDEKHNHAQVLLQYLQGRAIH